MVAFHENEQEADECPICKKMNDDLVRYSMEIKAVFDDCENSAVYMYVMLGMIKAGFDVLVNSAGKDDVKPEPPTQAFIDAIPFQMQAFMSAAHASAHGKLDEMVAKASKVEVVAIQDFLSREQFDALHDIFIEEKKIGRPPHSKMVAAMKPWMPEINRKIGQENDADYLCYMIEMIFNTQPPL